MVATKQQINAKKLRAGIPLPTYPANWTCFLGWTLVPWSEATAPRACWGTAAAAGTAIAANKTFESMICSGGSLTGGGSDQCCQLADISAAKHKSGPIKISAAGKIRGRIFCSFVKKWQKSGQTFLKCALHIKTLIICRNRLTNLQMYSTF
jgi:hypothetical protein